jgi:tetratricopeptide (TPR) repeat protein
LGRLRESLEDYEAALSKDPKLVAALLGRGQVKKKLGDLQGGEADIAKAKELDPGEVAKLREWGLAE